MSYTKMVMIPVDVYRNILSENQNPGNKEPPKTEPQQIAAVTRKTPPKVKKRTKKVINDKPPSSYKRKGKKFIRSILKNMSKRQLSAIVSHR